MCNKSLAVTALRSKGQRRDEYPPSYSAVPRGTYSLAKPRAQTRSGNIVLVILPGNGAEMELHPYLCCIWVFISVIEGRWNDKCHWACWLKAGARQAEVVQHLGLLREKLGRHLCCLITERFSLNCQSKVKYRCVLGDSKHYHLRLQYKYMFIHKCQDLLSLFGGRSCFQKAHIFSFCLEYSHFKSSCFEYHRLKPANGMSFPPKHHMLNIHCCKMLQPSVIAALNLSSGTVNSHL